MRLPKPDYKKEARAKKRLEKEADRLWHEAGKKKWGEACLFHGSSKQAKQHQNYTKFGHHFFRKGLYPQLRYDIDNFVNACWPCHFRLEKVDTTMAGDVILARGKRWYNKLLDKSQVKLKSGFQTKEYYKKTIDKLKKVGGE